jgi:hypothetical protein
MGEVGLRATIPVWILIMTELCVCQLQKGRAVILGERSPYFLQLKPLELGN